MGSSTSYGRTQSVEVGATEPVAPAPEAIPSFIGGRYRTTQEIGAGAFGVVYEAMDDRLRRSVAVKVLDQRHAGAADGVARFRAEALTLSRLSHPNLVGVTDFDLLPDGRPYLVMEHVAGQTLQQALAAGGALPVPTALSIAHALCLGLAAAHDRGVIHRDLKPGNIILDETQDPPVPKIVDFGIAKITDGTADGVETSPGHIFGTPAYMAPEQIRPGIGAVDGRTDLYALGVILFEMLIGRRPFAAVAHEAELFVAQVVDKPERPSWHRAGVSAELDAVVMRALAKRPDERFTSAREFAKALAAIQAGNARPRRVAWILSLAIAVALAALAAELRRGTAPATTVVEPPAPAAAEVAATPASAAAQPPTPASAAPDAGVPGRAPAKAPKRRPRERLPDDIKRDL